jgi:uncharacterized membrane protein (DUF4010 family)
VLARRARAAPALLHQAQSGIILATSIMYLRILIIVAMFNQGLAIALAPALLGLAAGGLLLAGLWHRMAGSPSKAKPNAAAPANPLELTAALVFAALFVAVSLASGWVRSRFGEAGLYGLAAIVGATDIDPFVLSVASGGAAPLPAAAGVAAILFAASSNNILKAIYTTGFVGGRAAIAHASALALLALAGGGIGWWFAGLPVSTG